MQHAMALCGSNTGSMSSSALHRHSSSSRPHVHKSCQRLLTHPSSSHVTVGSNSSWIAPWTIAAAAHAVPQSPRKQQCAASAQQQPLEQQSSQTQRTLQQDSGSGAAPAAATDSASRTGHSSSTSGNSSSSRGSSSSQRPPPLQVTRYNFQQALPALQEALSTCQFYSFDCEMSGLYPQGMEDYAVDDLDDRYLKTAAAAESFIVTQMGLSFFTWTGSHYEARSFNFHLFPSPSEELDLRFSCQASSLAFLAAHGFDFNKMIYEGLPYLPLSLRDRHAKAAAEAHKAAATPPSIDDLDDDERCLMQELEETINTWLQKQPPPPAAPAAAAGGKAAATTTAAAAAAAAGGTSNPADILHLPAPPPQLMRLQRRLLAAGIGSSRWNSSSSRNNSSSSSAASKLGWQYIVESIEGSGTDTVLRRATAAEVAAAAAVSKQQRQQQATAAAGFSHVMELLRDSRKPAVGHNLRFDLAFILAGFVQSPLPKTWSGFKDLVRSWFPGGVYDTKYLARSLTGLGVPGASALLPDTALESLFKPFCASVCSRQPLCTPSSFSSSQGDSAPHTHSLNTTSLSEWLQQSTSALEDPSLWTTLPDVQHALGCEQYAAAAAAAAGIPQQQQQVAAGPNGRDPAAAAGGGRGGGGGGRSGGAHEAGFDAFMTGVVFLGLLRLFEVTALSSMSRWLLPTAPSSPPQLDVVDGLVNRLYHSKSRDIPYAALQGDEVVPQRSNVLYITGFKGRLRWQDIQAHFAKLGLGKPVVSLVRDNSGTHTQVKGAYVVLQSAKDAVKALQQLRQDKTSKFTAMTYADYHHSKRLSRVNSPFRPRQPSLIQEDALEPPALTVTQPDSRAR